MRTLGLLLALAVLCSTQSFAQSSPFEREMLAAAALRPSSPASAVSGSTGVTESDVRRFNSRAPGATLMIIGGAAIVAGILVGDSGGAVLILGGIGIGAYGFYLYTR